MGSKLTKLYNQLKGNTELVQELLYAYRKKRVTALKDIEQYQRGIEQSKKNIEHAELRVKECDLLIELFETLEEDDKNE